MKIINRNLNSFQTAISAEEVRVIHQALNEVCHGMGEKRPAKTSETTFEISEMNRLREIYEDVKAKSPTVPIRLDLSLAQFNLYQEALTEVLTEIEDWEFSIRMGTSKQFAVELVGQFNEVDQQQ